MSLAPGPLAADQAQVSARRAAGLLPTFALTVCCLALVAGVTGITQRLAFSQASDLKYAATVVGPAVLLAAAMSRRPLQTLVALTVFAAPFSAFVVTVGGLAISVLTPFLVLSTALALAQRRRGPGASATAVTTPLALVLLVAPVVSALHPWDEIAILGQFVLLAWLVSVAARDQLGRDRVVLALVLSGGLHGLIALWQFKTGHTLSLYSSDVGGGDYASSYFYSYGDQKRPTSVFYDPNSLGNVLALTLPLGFAQMVSQLRRAHLGSALVLAAATVSAALGLALAFSRTSWVAAAVGLAVVVVGLPRGLRLRTAGAITVVGLVIAALALATAGPAVRERFSSITDPTSASVRTAQGDRTRLQLWTAAADIGRANPVTGVGFGRIGAELHERVAFTDEFSHAHSTYLQWFAEAGVGGLAALALLWGSVARDLRRDWRRTCLAAGVAGSAVTVLATWVTDYTVRYLAVAACVAPIIGLAASMSRRAGDSEPT